MSNTNLIQKKNVSNTNNGKMKIIDRLPMTRVGYQGLQISPFNIRFGQVLNQFFGT
jgi:hypothetical protein